MNLHALLAAPARLYHEQLTEPVQFIEALYSTVDAAIVAHTHQCTDVHCPIIGALSAFEGVLSGLAIEAMEMEMEKSDGAKTWN